MPVLSTSSLSSIPRNHQVEAKAYIETFSLVTKMASVRTFLVLAVAKKWELHQLGVNNTFLRDDLHEEVDMRHPPGLSTARPNKVCYKTHYMVFVNLH